jgi:hypothetical protein
MMTVQDIVWSLTSDDFRLRLRYGGQAGYALRKRDSNAPRVVRRLDVDSSLRWNVSYGAGEKGGEIASRDFTITLCPSTIKGALHRMSFLGVKRQRIRACQNRDGFLAYAQNDRRKITFNTSPIKGEGNMEG